MRTPDVLGRRNCALQAVPEMDWPRFSGRLEHAVLVEGRALHAESERVYFPTGGVVSLFIEDKIGHGVEALMMGSESGVGILASLSGQPSNMRAQVRVPGAALWMHADAFRQEFARGGAFAAWVLRYCHYTNAHLGQCALCSRRHSSKDQLARWLLTFADRLDSAELGITHEHIGQALGTRRCDVTVLLGSFQSAGLLKLSRGTILLINRAGLENVACNCYPKLRSAFDTLWAMPVKYAMTR